MKRIRTEILLSLDSGRLWVVEILKTTSDVFHVYRHYGAASQPRFVKRLVRRTECLASALEAFEKTLSKKLKKDKSYLVVTNDIHISSQGLMAVFKGTTERPIAQPAVPANNKPAGRKKEDEYRKLSL